MDRKPAKRATKATPPKRREQEPVPEPDVNQLAHHLVGLSTQSTRPQLVDKTVTPTEISRVMKELGRRGGKIGGKNRETALTPERRREIALKAARKRWDNAQR